VRLLPTVCAFLEPAGSETAGGRIVTFRASQGRATSTSRAMRTLLSARGVGATIGAAMSASAAFVEGLPKAELHVHLEGTLEPELKFELAARNGVDLPYASVDEMRAAYGFHDLSSFLAVYYEGMSVLQTERDFHDLAMAYFRKAASQNVLYAEVF